MRPDPRSENESRQSRGSIACLSGDSGIGPPGKQVKAMEPRDCFLPRWLNRNDTPGIYAMNGSGTARKFKFIQFHEDLPDDAKDRIKIIYRVVGHHLHSSFERFEHGFCFDLHYEKEIAIWSRVALGWVRFCKEHPEEAQNDPAKLIALMIAYSATADISKERCGKELADCYKNFSGEQEGVQP
jgi:hypothetical protein